MGASLILPQFLVEEALRDRLAAFGVAVELDSGVTAFTQDADRVVATTTRGAVTARYLVGCDGGRSTVRKALGVAFDGREPPRRVDGARRRRGGGLDPDHGYMWIDPDRGMLALAPFRTVAQWQFQCAAEGAARAVTRGVPAAGRGDSPGAPTSG